MSTRLTDEERIVQWFTEADLASARSVFRVVRGILRGREAGRIVRAPNLPPESKPKRGRPPIMPGDICHPFGIGPASGFLEGRTLARRNAAGPDGGLGAVEE